MIGMNIRVLRKKQKWSQEQLAEKLNVSRQTVAKWEMGRLCPIYINVKYSLNFFKSVWINYQGI